MVRQKLQDKHASYVFKVANDVYSKKIRFTDGKRLLVSEYGFNSNTAGDLINDFKYLMNGESFERTLNAFYSDYYLRNILAIYGESKLANATNSLAKHIEYYEGHYKTKLYKMRRVLETYKMLCNGMNENELEQSIIQNEIEQLQLNKEQLLKKIKLLESTDVEYIEIRGLQIKRRNWIISLIKKFYDYKCQVCNTSIKKKNGDFYIEAAHITAKRLKGHETLDNIILLCPNHHKEFDLGKTEITKAKDQIILNLNGVAYVIKSTF